MDASLAEPYRPADLGKYATMFWDDVVRTYVLRYDDLVNLAKACKELELIEELEEERAGRSLIAKGYNGQDVADPIITELRMHHNQLSSLMSKLKLPDVPGGEAGGRKPQETREDVSEKARQAANARWAKVRDSG